MIVHYYILSDIISIGQQSTAPLDTRIARFEFSSLKITLQHIPGEQEGPYDSIVALKKNSAIFKDLKQVEKERVLKQVNLIDCDKFILGFSSDEYCSEFVNVLHHVMTGKFFANRVEGVHYYDPDRIKIVEITKWDNRTRVFKAKILVLNNSGKWFEKVEDSSFFPYGWTRTQLLHESWHAYKSVQNKIEGSSISKTISGLPVKYIFRDGHLITFYPII